MAAYSNTVGTYGTWARDENRLTKWSAAATLFGVVTVGAQSGASTNVKYSYEFLGRPTHYVYGNGSLPDTSSRVFQDTP